MLFNIPNVGENDRGNEPRTPKANKRDVRCIHDKMTGHDETSILFVPIGASLTKIQHIIGEGIKVLICPQDPDDFIDGKKTGPTEKIIPEAIFERLRPERRKEQKEMKKDEEGEEGEEEVMIKMARKIDLEHAEEIWIKINEAQEKEPEKKLKHRKNDTVETIERMIIAIDYKYSCDITAEEPSKKWQSTIFKGFKGQEVGIHDEAYRQHTKSIAEKIMKKTHQEEEAIPKLEECEIKPKIIEATEVGAIAETAEVNEEKIEAEWELEAKKAEEAKEAKRAKEALEKEATKKRIKEIEDEEYENFMKFCKAIWAETDARQQAKETAWEKEKERMIPIELSEADITEEPPKMPPPIPPDPWEKIFNEEPYKPPMPEQGVTYLDPNDAEEERKVIPPKIPKTSPPPTPPKIPNTPPPTEEKPKTFDKRKEFVEDALNVPY